MNSKNALMVVLVFWGGSRVFAGTINFDNAPMIYWKNGGGVDVGGYYQGVTFGPDAQIATSSATYPAHSGNLELTTANIADPVITITFNATQPDVSFWYSTSFGFVAVAYDSQGNFLGFANGNPNVDLSTSIGTDSLLDFGFGDISSVVITDDGGLGNFLTIDDLTAFGVSGLPASNNSTTPTLSIAHTGTNVIVSWVAPSSGYILQQNTNLATGAGWTNSLYSITTANGTNSITFTPSGRSLFFRLGP
jgi:hypothetical protein